MQILMRNKNRNLKTLSWISLIACILLLEVPSGVLGAGLLYTLTTPRCLRRLEAVAATKYFTSDETAQILAVTSNRRKNIANTSTNILPPEAANAFAKVALIPRSPFWNNPAYFSKALRQAGIKSQFEAHVLGLRPNFEVPASMGYIQTYSTLQSARKANILRAKPRLSKWLPVSLALVAGAGYLIYDPSSASFLHEKSAQIIRYAPVKFRAFVDLSEEKWETLTGHSPPPPTSQP